MVCQWPMRMVLGVFSVNEDRGQEEVPWGPKKVLWGAGHDAPSVHIDPLALRLSMTSVTRDKGRDRFFNKLFN